MAGTYDIGDLVRVFAEWRDNGVALDPTTVTLRIKDAAGAVTTFVFGTDPELVKDAVGDYHADVSADAVGRWRYRWESTGTGQAAQADRFQVKDTFGL